VESTLPPRTLQASFRVGSAATRACSRWAKHESKSAGLCGTQTGEVTMHNLLVSAYTDRATGR
jgi:hypothetical protein